MRGPAAHCPTPTSVGLLRSADGAKPMARPRVSRGGREAGKDHRSRRTPRAARSAPLRELESPSHGVTIFRAKRAEQSTGHPPAVKVISLPHPATRSRRGQSHRLRPGASPRLLRIPPHAGHPVLPNLPSWDQRGSPRFWRRRPPSTRPEDADLAGHVAARHTRWGAPTACRIHDASGVSPETPRATPRLSPAGPSRGPGMAAGGLRRIHCDEKRAPETDDLNCIRESHLDSAPRSAAARSAFHKGQWSACSGWCSTRPSQDSGCARAWLQMGQRLQMAASAFWKTPTSGFAILSSPLERSPRPGVRLDACLRSPRRSSGEDRTPPQDERPFGGISGAVRHGVAARGAAGGFREATRNRLLCQGGTGAGNARLLIGPRSYSMRLLDRPADLGGQACSPMPSRRGSGDHGGTTPVPPLRHTAATRSGSSPTSVRRPPVRRSSRIRRRRASAPGGSARPDSSNGRRSFTVVAVAREVRRFYRARELRLCFIRQKPIPRLERKIARQTEPRLRVLPGRGSALGDPA